MERVFFKFIFPQYTIVSFVWERDKKMFFFYGIYKAMANISRTNPSTHMHSVHNFQWTVAAILPALFICCLFLNSFAVCCTVFFQFIVAMCWMPFFVFIFTYQFDIVVDIYGQMFHLIVRTRKKTFEMVTFIVY